MFFKIKYLASWTRVKLNKQFGQRGAEMVEYAIVLACIAAVCVYFYSDAKPSGTGHIKLSVILGELWEKINNIIPK